MQVISLAVSTEEVTERRQERMKLFAGFLMAFILLSIVSASPDLSNVGPKKETFNTGVGIITHAQTSNGGSSSCKTLWAWNGFNYVKRDVVFKQSLYKGTNMENIKGNVVVNKVTNDGLLLDIIRDGSHCKTLNQKPRTPGAFLLEDDLSPLPFEFWRN